MTASDCNRKCRQRVHFFKFRNQESEFLNITWNILDSYIYTRMYIAHARACVRVRVCVREYRVFGLNLTIFTKELSAQTQQNTASNPKIGVKISTRLRLFTQSCRPQLALWPEDSIGT